LLTTIFDGTVYDSGARFLFTDGSFASIDPYAEKYPWISPYAYCAGNPINLTDPDGNTIQDKIVGALIGITTNIVPGSGFIRDIYKPEDKNDYNNTLQAVDNAAMIVAAGMISGGGGMIAGGEAASGAGTSLVLTGVGAEAGAVFIAGGAATVSAGEATVMAGTMMMANASDNANAGYDRGKKGDASSSKSESSNKPLSARQVQKKIEKGQAPKSIDRADNPHNGDKGKPHIHFKDGRSINNDGTIHDKSKYSKQLNNAEKQFLLDSGWILPK
jgi:hypothetical protein